MPLSLKNLLLKSRYSEKATKFWKKSPNFLTLLFSKKCHKSGRFCETFVAFSEYMNFNIFNRNVWSQKENKSLCINKINNYHLFLSSHFEGRLDFHHRNVSFYFPKLEHLLLPHTLNKLIWFISLIKKVTPDFSFLEISKSVF